MPATIARLNLVDGLGPALQLAEGVTVELPQEAHDILDHTAGECMKRGPRTIEGGELASSALKLMEDHRITSLFICGAGGRLEGVVHIHDLWRLELF